MGNKNIKTPGNFGYGDMPADFRMRYKQIMAEKNKKKVKNKKDENPMERISRILYGGQ